MSTPTQSFQDFMAQRLAASTAFVNGDIEPLAQISTHTSPATIFGPRGDTVEGADQVNTVNAQGAAMFEPGGENTFEVMHSAADGDLAYWTGIQRSVVRMRDREDPVPIDLRVTEVFRREDGRWMLIHRHADPLSR